MAFVSEEITENKDKEFFRSIAFTSMTGDALNPGWWTIDRERNMVLYERGGGSFDVPIGYGLYIDGNTVQIEVTEATEGDRHDGDLKVHYFINKIEIPKGLIPQNGETDAIVDIIKEAFLAMGVPYVDRSHILEVSVKVTAQPDIIK
ncbi:MAG: hypothetical protein NC347_12380 [Clostridium sp.]|nr:hypothetical protein [Clostridium sp.]